MILQEAAAAYVDMQMVVQEQAPVEVPGTDAAAMTSSADSAMQIDEPSQQRASSKRKAEEEPEADPHKKAKVGMCKLHSSLCVNLNFYLV